MTCCSKIKYTKKNERERKSRILKKRAKEFGTIADGEEEPYIMMLSTMEGNLLKKHREDSCRNGRRAMEAVSMSLLKTDGYLRGIEYDFSALLNEENKALLDGLLMSFDPFTNPELYAVLEGSGGVPLPEEFKDFFEFPVKCLLKVYKSIHFWTENYGENAYFQFIEPNIGKMVGDDKKMLYTCKIGMEAAMNMGIQLP